MRKNKRTVTVKKRKKKGVSSRFVRGQPPGPGRPKGSLGLKGRIFNELLETFSEIKGKKRTKDYAKGDLKKGSRNFATYLNHIVTLVKGNNDDHPHKIDLTIKLGGSSGTKGKGS